MTQGAQLSEVVGAGQRGSFYDLADTQIAAGSTLGGPKCVCIIKATGAIEKIYSTDYGKTVIGTVVPHHWDESTGIPLTALPGTFRIHPEHQEHFFRLSNGIAVHEDIFVLSTKPRGDRVDPPAVYFTITLSNPTNVTRTVGTYAFAQLRGELGHDVESAFDKRRNALIAWNTSDPSLARVITCSETVTSWETTMDDGKAIAPSSPGMLAGKAQSPATDPLGVLHLSHTLKPNDRVQFTFIFTFSLEGSKRALAVGRALPAVSEALYGTRAYYHEILNRSVVLTPDHEVNAGVLWAKANMLRTVLLAPTGWCFVNDPSRSNNSVGRDTAWFAFGADYILPEFAEASLLWYAEHLEAKGLVVEYYDVRTGKTADYKLNINDNTPLLILALWHHFNTTGERKFLERIYPSAVKAAKYILSQRNEQGLVWCTADGVSDWGIVGWRNVIADYRLSGATTEVNSECYAALLTVSHMARVLGKHAASATFKSAAEALRDSINEHLFDTASGLYYLNIQLDGTPRSDVTSDLVFPVMFGVADDVVAAGIIARLSAREFWSDAGIRTVPPQRGQLRTDARLRTAGRRVGRRCILVCVCRGAVQQREYGVGPYQRLQALCERSAPQQYGTGPVFGMAARRDFSESRDDALALVSAALSVGCNRGGRGTRTLGRHADYRAATRRAVEVDVRPRSVASGGSRHVVYRARARRPVV